MRQKLQKLQKNQKLQGLKMKVVTLVKFNDLKTGITRNIGDTFEVSKARYEEILSFGQFVEEVKDSKAKPKKKK